MPITLGPLIGHTTSTKVKVWLRGENLGDGTLPFATVDLYQNGQRIRSVYGVLLEAQDYSGVIEFDSLSPSTEYDVVGDCVHFEPDDIPKMNKEDVGHPLSTSEWARVGHFKTAPANPSSTLRFAFGSCRWLNRIVLSSPGGGDKTFRSIGRLHETTPFDFIMMIGDQVYTDALDKLGWLGELKSLGSFFELYRDTFEQKHFRHLTSHVPTYMILDDHEIEDDWSRNQLVCGDEDDESRYFYAMQAYHAYQHQHNPPTQGSPGSENTELWYSMEWGGFPFFFLDNMTQKWTERKDPNDDCRSPTDLKPPTMLGENQMTQLKEWLREKKDAPRKFIVTPEPIFPDRFDKDDELVDKWHNFNEERAQLLHFIRKEKIRDVVLLGGAVHNSHLATLTCDQDPDFKITSLVSSPFYAVFGNYREESQMCLEKTLHLKDQETGPAYQFKYTTEGFFCEDSFMVVDIDITQNPACKATAYLRNGDIQEGYPISF